MHRLLTLLGLAGTLSLAPAAVRQAPRIVKPGEHRVGRLIADLEFETIDGKSGRLSDHRADALVVAFTGVGCPLTKKFAPELAAIEDSFKGQKVAFLYVNPTESDDAREQLSIAREHGFDGPVIHDVKGSFGRALGAMTTTDVFVLDQARTLVYRGAVSDQYGIGYAKESSSADYLKDAINATLKGAPTSVTATWAPGCALEFDEAKTSVADVTYHNRVSRIIQENCLECHRKGGVAPFSLATYKDVVGNAAMIRSVVKDGLMPPWFAEPVKGVEHAWENDRSLGEADRRDLIAWLGGDQPVGDPADAPLLRGYPSEWSIGQPDEIVSLPRAVTVKATGQMPYVNLKVKTNHKEDRWVTATEIRPTFAEVVHHVLVFVIPKQETGKRRNLNSEDRGFLAAYVPGNTWRKWGDGFAKHLPAGATLHFQMHYTPNGRVVEDQTRLGLTFAKEAPRNVVKIAGLSNHQISIPPRAPNHRESKRLHIPNDVEILSFLPHMHLRGKAFRYDLLDPDGGRRTLLDIPEYDFNWQLQYRYTKPLLVKAGSTIEALAWYDNSAANPANPNPDETVKWGDQTDEEMLIGYIEYYVPGGSTQSLKPSSPAPDGGDINRQLAQRFRAIDRDGDGTVTPAELSDRPLFAALDEDDNQRITLPEADRAMKRITANFRDRALRTKEGRDYVMNLFRRLDANHDNRLTQSEVPAVLRQRIATADRNGDSVVTQSELEQVLSAPGRRR